MGYFVPIAGYFIAELPMILGLDVQGIHSSRHLQTSLKNTSSQP